MAFPGFLGQRPIGLDHWSFNEIEWLAELLASQSALQVLFAMRTLMFLAILGSRGASQKKALCSVGFNIIELCIVSLRITVGRLGLCMSFGCLDLLHLLPF